MRFTALVLAALLAAPRPVAADSRNLLPNPSFEPPAGGGDNTNPPGWVRWSEAGTGGQHAWDSGGGRAHRREGDATMYALQVVSPGGRAGWELAEPVPIKDDRAYVLTGFVSVHRAAGEARIALRFMGPDGVLGEAWSPAVTGSTGADRMDWVGVAVRAVPPDGTTRAQVVLRADHLVGDAWFDDVCLLPAGERAPDLRLVRARAFRALRADGDDAPAFTAVFDPRAARAADAVAALRRDGREWEPAGVALERARLRAAAGLQDLRAGWDVRGWNRLEAAAAALVRAEALADAGKAVADALPAPGGGSFPCGVVLPIHGPVDPAWLADQVALLGRVGARDVLMDVPWGIWERVQGTYDFALLDAALAAARKAGLTFWGGAGPVYALTGGRMSGAKSSLAGFTDWFLARHPESALESDAGERVRDCDGLFWKPAWQDPARLDAEPAWMTDLAGSDRALAARAAGQPAFGGWLLSARASLGAGPDDQRHLARPGLLGANPAYATGFRHWLKERYGRPAQLRESWGRGAPADFAGADPPGAAEILAAQPPSASRYAGASGRIADWLEYRATALAEGLAWQGRQLGAPATVAAPWLDALTPAGPLDPDGLAAEAFAAAGAGPVAMELAPDGVPFPLLTHAQDVALAAAGPVAAARPLWLVNYRFHASGLFGGVDRQDLFPEAYAAPYLASAVTLGVRGVFFAGWTGKTGTASFVSAPRAPATEPALADEGLAALDAARSFAVVKDWLAGARPARPRYGVLVSRRSQLFDDPDGAIVTALLDGLALAGLPDVRVVSERELEAGPPACEVLFAPCATRISAAALASATRWVEDGGLLLADAFLAGRTPAGDVRRPLGEGLAGLFGVGLQLGGTSWSDASLIGVQTAAGLPERTPPVAFSLSFYTGGWRLRALPGTEVLAEYTSGAWPAVTVHAAGRGRAVLLPRVMLSRSALEALRAEQVSRPELRELRLGRSAHHLNGFYYALTLRAVLEHLGALPPARLVRATVATPFLDEQGAMLRDAGIRDEDVARSAAIVRETQAGLPYFARDEAAMLRRLYRLDPDAFATVRVSMLERPAADAAAAPSRMAIVTNVASWPREAVLALPPCGGAVDLLTGEAFRPVAGRLAVSLGAYQVRLLAFRP